MSGAPSPLGSTGSTTIVLAALLVLVGIAMICTAVWLVRATRTDSRSLGPLEVMGDRSWRRRDAASRSRTLDAARPEGAPPPAPILERDPDDPPPITSVPARADEPATVDADAEADVAAGAPASVPTGTPTTPEAAVADGDGGDDDRVDEPQPAERS